MEVNTSTATPWILLDDQNVTDLVTQTNIAQSDEANTTVSEVPNKTFPVELRDEPWVIPLMVMSSLNIFAIACFEVYILYKSCGSRRHLFLGQTLLLGLFLCSLLAFVFVATPHWFLCGVIRAGVGIVYVIVFATLLMKCVFLTSLHVGFYITSSYQSLLLFFAFGVQIAISAQWLVYRPPEIITAEYAHNVEVCRASPIEKIQYLCYAMFLLFLVIVFSIRGRSLKENNREAMYIGIATGIVVVIWVAWTVVHLVFDRRFEDPAQGFGLVCTALVIFLLVFIPKAVQLSASERKNGSTNGSQSMVFAPSFLQLQPHAILPESSETTLVRKKHSTGSNADYCRGYASRLWRYDYPTFYKGEPPMLGSIDRSSNRKSNVSFINTNFNN